MRPTVGFLTILIAIVWLCAPARAQPNTSRCNSDSGRVDSFTHCPAKVETGVTLRCTFVSEYLDRNIRTEPSETTITIKNGRYFEIKTNATTAPTWKDLKSVSDEEYVIDEFGSISTKGCQIFFKKTINRITGDFYERYITCKTHEPSRHLLNRSTKGTCEKIDYVDFEKPKF